MKARTDIPQRHEKERQEEIPRRTEEKPQQRKRIMLEEDEAVEEAKQRRTEAKPSKILGNRSSSERLNTRTPSLHLQQLSSDIAQTLSKASDTTNDEPKATASPTPPMKPATHTEFKSKTESEYNALKLGSECQAETNSQPEKMEEELGFWDHARNPPPPPLDGSQLNRSRNRLKNTSNQQKIPSLGNQSQSNSRSRDREQRRERERWKFP